MNIIFGNHQVYNTYIPLDNLRLKAMFLSALPVSYRSRRYASLNFTSTTYLLSFAKIVQQIDIHKFCEDKFIYINNSNENLYDSQINSKFAVIRKQIKKPK